MPPQHDNDDGAAPAAAAVKPANRRVRVTSPRQAHEKETPYAVKVKNWNGAAGGDDGDAASPPLKPFQQHQQHQQQYYGEDDGGDYDAPPEKARSQADSQAETDLTDDSATTGISSGERAARNAGMTKIRFCGLKIKVSFITWTFLAMLIPIGFLVGSTAAAAAESVDELAMIRHHIPMATAGSNCVTAISEEHARTLRYILSQNNESLADMNARRLQFHVDCTLAFTTELLMIRAENSYFAKNFEAWALASREIAVMRDRVDQMTTLTAQERARYTEDLMNAFDATARAVTNGMALPADLVETAASRYFLNIKLTADARKSLWTAAASTLSLAGATPGPNADADLVRSLADIRAALAVLIALQGVASPELRTEMDTWEAEPTSSSLLNDFTHLAERYPSMNREVFFDTAQVALDRLREVERSQLEHAHRSQAVADKVVTNLAVLISGVAVCMVAASLLTWQQLRTKNELQDQVMRAEKTRKAVSAFVPKFFLKKMGYTSITQVEVGESTDVALAMMLCDIRKFATVSENMTSSELFQWVQSFFQRMTTNIERSEGNISRFTGDSLFAVFTSCRQALHCAIDIQAEAQEMNIGKLCREQDDVPVDLGVGLHHDVLAMGVLGDEGRHTVAAIASSVNQASRLQNLTKQLGCRILATDAVIEQLGNNRRGSVDALDSMEFLIRRVGPALETSTGKSIVIYDIFQADDRLTQHYKLETKQLFERYAMMILDGDAEDDEDAEASANALRDSLLQKAAEMGVADRMTEQLHVLLEERRAQARDDDDGR